MIDRARKYVALGVSAIAIPCSARKEKLPAPGMRAMRLPKGTQSAVAKVWSERLAVTSSSGLTVARDLYDGSSFRRTRSLADQLGCSLYIVSAGLGLVPGETRIPSYDLTLSALGEACLRARVTSRFIPSAWWDVVQASPFAVPMSNMGKGDGRILIALTQPYADLSGAALEALPDRIRWRLRILGAGHTLRLPSSLRAQMIVYDKRLDSLVPGIRLDGASRALEHFAGLVATAPIAAIADDQRAVESALSRIPRPVEPNRVRMSDDVLVKKISRLARRGLSATRALKHLREEAGVACESRRFRRLYEEAMA